MALSLTLSLLGVGGSPPVNVSLDDAEQLPVVPREFLVRASPESADVAGLPVVGRVGFGWTLVRVSRAGEVGKAAQQAQDIARLTGFEVEPNYIYQLADEPLFSDQWGLENTGQTGGTVDADVDILDAWAQTTGNPAVIIAVLDSGATLGHPDLASVLWINTGEIGGNGIDDDGNGFVDDVNGWDFANGDSDPSDILGHGTFVASVAVGAVNGVGIAGVAPDSVFMPIRVCNPGCSNSAIIAGLSYAVDNGADVANMSFGCHCPSAAMETALVAASDAGMTLVAAAGNHPQFFPPDNDIKAFYPANYEVDGLISVAATDHDDALASFSHFGATSVDLAAPGVDILGADFPVGWRLWSGTSFAAPHVAGVAALIKSLHTNASPTQVKKAILDSVDVKPGLVGKMVTGGRLNAGTAVTIEVNVPPVAAGQVTPTLGKAPLVVMASAGESNDPDGAITEWLWSVGAVTVSGEDVNLFLEEIGVRDVNLTVTDDFGASSATQFEVLVGTAFEDTDGSIFHDSITWLSAMGITNGCNPPVNDRFCPNDFVTRGQMAAFLVRAMGYADDGGGNLFIDDDGNIFEAAIDRLGAAGVTKGCNPPVNDRFCPNDFVTRGQMAAFLVRAMGYTDDGGGNLFTDDDGNIFEAAIDKLGAAGVTKGCNPPVNDHFCPNDFVTRGQMAAFLKRALGT